MNKHQHPSNNDVLGAPKGWDQSELPCSALPITRVKFGELDAVVSYWRPSESELAILNSGGSVEISILGRTIPPIMVGVDPQ